MLCFVMGFVSSLYLIDTLSGYIVYRKNFYLGPYTRLVMAANCFWVAAMFVGNAAGAPALGSSPAAASAAPRALGVVYSLTHLLTASLAHSLTCSLTHSCAHLLYHVLIRSLGHLLTHSLTH